jgi:hypothetical protein
VTYPADIDFTSGQECFGAHLGAPQTANLGDGNGWVNQTIELRDDYGNPDIGSCWESLVGGNHLRLFRQNGAKADTNALFLAYVNQRIFFRFLKLILLGLRGQCFFGRGDTRFNIRLL